ncbi:hypothetical protein [Paraburkholderia kururiensis]|uniref:hypothetical protein n=1 Tax=Paraburkholderia kururiensis TaxID=984307 RepID=UPI0018F7B0DB|nr:hypothetical protein [Paraburkholderia kururiensis]
MTTRNEPRSEPFAYCYGNSEYGYGRIIVELRNYVVNAFGDAYMGDIRIRCSFSEQFEDAYAFELEYHSHIGARLNELRAAVRKMAVISRRLTACNEKLGHTDDFAEYAHRALVAAGITRLHVDPNFGLSGSPATIGTLPAFDTSDADAVKHAIGLLVQEGLRRYAKQPAQQAA